MKKHTKIYMDYFGYVIDDIICCEVCGGVACDTHHIEARGMGGSKSADNIENLMAVCRQCHVKYGDKKQYIDFLKDIHNQLLENK